MDAFRIDQDYRQPERQANTGGSVEKTNARMVLIVEDEWLVRMELSDAFEDAGFAILESASAEHAAIVLRENADIALLVTDIRLTGLMDGWDLAREARVVNPAIAVIYLSANPPAADRMVGDGVFIDKPALMDNVTATAQRLIDPRS